MDALDEITRKRVTRKGTLEPGGPQEVDCYVNWNLLPNCHSIPGSAVHDRRCNEVITTAETTNQLTEALNYEGCDLKRSSISLQFLPRNPQPLDGKRHVHTAHFKLYKSQNSKDSSHISTKFARSSIKSLEESDVVLGPAEVNFHSMDEKTKVPISITAAKKQIPLPMHMEYQNILPDHYFVVGCKHKLITSVIGDMKDIKSKHFSNDAASYSNPTYISIKSAKDSSSSSFHSLLHMNKVHYLPRTHQQFSG